MNDLAVSVAGLQTLGAPLSIDVAREADALGFGSVWVAEANAAEAMALLGAISQVAPHSGLGTTDSPATPATARIMRRNYSIRWTATSLLMRTLPQPVEATDYTNLTESQAADNTGRLGKGRETHAQVCGAV